MRRLEPDPVLVREQLFLLAHDETRHMRPRLHVPALAAGLAGATVMDLLITQRVAIESGVVHADRFQRDSTGDPITDDVLALIMDAVPAPALPAVLRAAGPGLYERTAAALVHKGVIVEGPQRRWRKAKEYEIANERIAVRVRARVGYRIDGRDAPSPDADCLCALVAVLGLHAALLRGPRAEVEPMLHRVVQDLPANARQARGDGDPPHPVAAAPVVASAVLDAVRSLATAAMN
ncbi:GOLPH3/VPS74 family protein [Actinoplanes aureus]|uniref:GPP34 family phosphoprotein n=1 Tax=Actinoplanes aureus TaxID=2792083 RepID=A0A931G0K4_9ACTN|nr:GPP34 family phosphoprotein [Actinoplanes aureus]MBG0561479.1 GPP34 family phosphoprotein [Actinoplanes aureus]